MTKKYISNRDLSINIKLGKSSKHISFTPLTLSGSVYYTDDKDIQDALAKHPYYGSLFFVEDLEEEKEQPLKKEAPQYTERNVTCLDDARDILSDEFGISRTKIRTIDAIKNAAENVGVKFIGL